MMTVCDIIFWIPMVFVVVSSGSFILDGEPGAVCNVSVSRQKFINSPYNFTYQRRIWWTVFIFSENVTRTIYRPTAYNVSVVERKCCEGYKNQSGICQPQCSENCKNCTRPNVCTTCNYGWGGDSCDESLLCVVRSNSSQEISAPNMIQKVDKDIKECHEECHDRMGRTVANVSEHENIVPCLLPLDCRCTSGLQSDSWKTCVSLLCVVVGIALFSMAIYVFYIVKRKLEARKEMSNVPVKSGIPLDYMEENTIYS